MINIFFLLLPGHRRQLPEQRCQGKLLDSSVCECVCTCLWSLEWSYQWQPIAESHSRMPLTHKPCIDLRGLNLFLLTHWLCIRQLLHCGSWSAFVCVLHPTNHMHTLYLRGWLAQSPVPTSCPSWQSTGKLRRHFSTFPPWWGSPGWAQWNERCCRGRWSPRCGTRKAHTRQSRLRYKTETPCYPRCLSPSEGWPLPSRALSTQREIESFKKSIQTFL